MEKMKRQRDRTFVVLLPTPPAAEEAVRKQLFPGAHRVEVKEIPVTPEMREQMKGEKK